MIRGKFWKFLIDALYEANEGHVVVVLCGGLVPLIVAIQESIHGGDACIKKNKGRD